MGNNLKNIYLVANNIISSLGFNTQENLLAIKAKQSGIRPTTNKNISDTPILAGLIDEVRLNEESKKYNSESYSKLEQLIIISIEKLIAQKQIDMTSPKLGVLISTTKGNIDLLKNHTENLNPNVFLGNTARKIEEHFGLKNEVQVVSNACISGLSALIVAQRQLQCGKLRHAIVVGADILCNFITSGFLSFKSVSENICKPYDSSRDGLSLGEACGSILLTSDPTPHSIVLRSGAISNDANHISGPSRTGDGLYLTINNAMDEAGVTPQDIDFLNLHGTATVYNDEMEAKAVNLVHLQNVPANSLKPYFGHTLGASGVIETIVCMHQLKESTVFATPNYSECGLTVPLNINAEHLKLPTAGTCIKTASGFGGCNAAIVLSTEPHNSPECEPKETGLIGHCLIKNNSVKIDNQPVFNSESKDFHTFIRETFKNLGENNQKFYKMDDLSKLGYIAATYLLKDFVFAPTEMAVILANKSSSLDTDTKFQQIIDNDGDAAASPAVFVYTLPSIVAGEICIRHKIQGENTFFVNESYNENQLREYAQMVIQKKPYKYCLYGWVEFLKDNYSAEFNLIEKK